MEKEKRKAFAELLKGMTKQEWEFIRGRVDLKFSSVSCKVVLNDDTEEIADAIKDNWNEN